MIDASKLLEKNYIRNRKINLHRLKGKENEYFIQYNYKDIGAQQIREIASDLFYLKRTTINKINKLYIVFYSLNPLDKLVDILLETMIYEIMSNYKLSIQIQFKKYLLNINTNGLFKSPLGKYIKNVDVEKFKKQFNRMVDGHNFRRVISIDKDGYEGPALISSEVRSFLKPFDIDKDCISNLSLVVGELVDNVYDHAQSDCLIDIDITEREYIKQDNETDNLYYAVNVVVLNFSKKCLFEDVKNKFKNKLYSKHERYDMVQEIFNKHESFFGKKYNADDFYMLSSFQKGISGRENETKTGGTGLSNFIRELAVKSQEDYCYLLTGENGLVFKKELLKYNDDGWIGFNKSNDFNKIPDDGVVFHTKTFLPGTAYNFLLVFGG